MSTSEEFIPVGKISGIFGVKGWMKIFSFTEPRKNILNYSPLYMSKRGEWVEVNVTGGRVHGKGIVLSFSDVTDPDQVQPLIGNELAITKQQLKPAGNNEFYWSQLIGLTVVSLQDEPLGVVASLLETGAHDVLVVEDKAQKTQRLIPFVMDEIVDSVDLDNSVIRVDWELDY